MSDKVTEMVDALIGAGNDVHVEWVTSFGPRLIWVNNGPELTELQFVDLAKSMMNEATGLPHF